MKLLLLIPLTAFVIYYEVRYRRIPNKLVLVTLLAGLVINTSYGGVQGGISSASGFLLAFVPMFLMHIFATMGAGDVKLFAAVGAVLGVGLVPLTLFVVVMLAGAFAVFSMVRAGTVFSTLHGVLRIFVGILPGWEMPRFEKPADPKQLIPYGAAIMLGSVIAAALFRG